MVRKRADDYARARDAASVRCRASAWAARDEWPLQDSQARSWLLAGGLRDSAIIDDDYYVEKRGQHRHASHG